jgi:FtsZ-binding cell division protein ZapB
MQSVFSALDILHANLLSSSKIISSNALFVTLSAATVLIASSVVPGLSGNLDDLFSPHATAVTKAFEILEAHEWRVEGAIETKTKLQEFLETVRKANRRQQGEPASRSTQSYISLLASLEKRTLTRFSSYHQ